MPMAERCQNHFEEGNLDPNELSIAKEGKKKDFRDAIAECGADALRFALIAYSSQSDRINLDTKRVVGYRQWCNKLWNAIRFAMGKLGDHYIPPTTVDVSPMTPICKWILSVLNKASSKTVTSLEAYKFADATSTIYSWWQYQLCDVFIEAIKPYFFSDSQEFESARAASRDTVDLPGDWSAPAPPFHALRNRRALAASSAAQRFVYERFNYDFGISISC